MVIWKLLLECNRHMDNNRYDKKLIGYMLRNNEEIKEGVLNAVGGHIVDHPARHSGISTGAFLFRCGI